MLNSNVNVCSQILGTPLTLQNSPYGTFQISSSNNPMIMDDDFHTNNGRHMLCVTAVLIHIVFLFVFITQMKRREFKWIWIHWIPLTGNHYPHTSMQVFINVHWFLLWMKRSMWWKVSVFWCCSMMNIMVINIIIYIDSDPEQDGIQQWKYSCKCGL